MGTGRMPYATSSKVLALYQPPPALITGVATYTGNFPRFPALCLTPARNVARGAEHNFNRVAANSPWKYAFACACVCLRLGRVGVQSSFRVTSEGSSEERRTHTDGYQEARLNGLGLLRHLRAGLEALQPPSSSASLQALVGLRAAVIYLTRRDSSSCFGCDR